MDPNVITTIVNLCFVAVGAIVSYVVFMANTRKDSKNDGRDNGIIINKLGVLEQSMNDINRKLERQEERHYQLVQRIVALETNAEQTEHRVDNLHEMICGENPQKESKKNEN